MKPITTGDALAVGHSLRSLARQMRPNPEAAQAIGRVGEWLVQSAAELEPLCALVDSLIAIKLDAERRRRDGDVNALREWMRLPADVRLVVCELLAIERQSAKADAPTLEVVQ
jgi:hypothetical protein